MASEKEIPKESGIDNSVAVLREGYLYGTNRAQAFQSDLFKTRLLGQEAICIRGEEAAELFYDNEKFKRAGAAPKRVVKTLFGKGGVQALDGEAHHHRKAMFMSLMSKETLKDIRAIASKQWELAAQRWQNQSKVVLYEEAQEVMCRTAFEWAGIPLEEEEVKDKAEWFRAMIEAPAAIGPAHWKGRRNRGKAESWVKELVEDVRTGKRQAAEGKTLHTMSFHRELNGEWMDAQTAAVEIINILRPIVAISIYICFTALAVHQHPQEREKLGSDEEKLQHFVQEVRRFYPFFPFVPARPIKDFTWNGYPFKKGTLVLLDLYGTNHHPQLWDNPEQFRPDRFATWNKSPFAFIPQGGGDRNTGHRCAGEWITIEIMKESLDFLVNRIDYTVPEQDLRFRFNEMPALPHSQFVMTNVRFQ
ncbi:cytochrome P450 [Shouchella clausii]|uniref:cytochrome P450 n=1 Tax=Shouchella clausii TaxID=79880 RepID=UPI000BA7AD19|nr:cytochrome P450 [Shouchella clausii]PAE97028.1 cytochrome P450 [Shouchella clausii]